MTAQDALADARLRKALRLQRLRVELTPQDAKAQLFLVELLLLAERLKSAWRNLHAIECADPDWPGHKERFRQLIRAASRRLRFAQPASLFPLPPHAQSRHRAIRSLVRQDGERAIREIDRADERSPILRGHIDGREFAGLRDADDRYATVLEVIVDGSYIWVPFEQLQSISLQPVQHVLDRAYRPATLRDHLGGDHQVLLPLIYPHSAARGIDEVFTLGLEMDFPESESGAALCVGAKWLLLDEEEVALSDVHQIEIHAERRNNRKLL